jgi:hypothetical protein
LGQPALEIDRLQRAATLSEGLASENKKAPHHRYLSQAVCNHPGSAGVPGRALDF